MLRLKSGFFRVVAQVMFSILLASGADAGNMPDDAFSKASPGAKPVNQQFEIAYKLVEEMSITDAWDIESFRTNHRRIIDECPDTPWAIESLWRLSNLYLTGQPVADRQEVISLMEYALKRYPGNPWEDRFTSRLINTLNDVHDYERLFELCESLLKKPDLPQEKLLPYNLRAGQASEALGNKDTAVAYYENILQHDPNNSTMFARIAHKRLVGLGIRSNIKDMK